jgi:uncharacterized protein
MDRFRILSLDGGGVRGVYSAAALAAIEEEIGGSITDFFDLITGTSTGGILGIGLGLGLPARRLLGFYQERAQEIFPSTGLLAKTRQLITSKHDSTTLRSALKQEFGNRKLGDSRRPLVITSYNASRDGPHLFKTFHHPAHDRHYQMDAADIALATSAAPLYFRSVKLPLGTDRENQTFLDGGIWANCPVVVGIAEAVRYFHVPLDQIDVLSIGTTYKPFRIVDSQMGGGLVQWRWALISLLFSAQQSSSVGTANVLLSNPIARITNRVEAEIALDATKASQMAELADLGRDNAQMMMPKLHQRFFSGPAPSFTPIRCVE